MHPHTTIPEEGFILCHMSTERPTLPNRVRELRLKRGLTQKQLAALVNRDHSTIGKIERGINELNASWAKLLAPALHCQPRDLFHGNVASVGIPLQDIPIISWVEAGALSPEAEIPEVGSHEFLSYPSERGSLIALRVTSDSMDMVAPKGSIIIVDVEDRDPVDGAYYVFRLDGSATFKRYRADPPRLTPYSHNPEHEPIFLGREEVEIVGRVTDVVHRLV